MKHYGYGSGMSGCLFDNGPHFCETEEDAIEQALFIFEYCLSEEELEEAKESLQGGGTYYFKDAAEAGAQCVQVWSEDGPLECPNWEAGVDCDCSFCTDQKADES